MRTAALALLLGLAACATPFEARVNRFQQLPAPSGQTFSIQSHDTRKAGGLEFSTYANLVRQRLVAQGFRESGGPGAASMVVDLDYGVTQPRERVETIPGYGGFGAYPWGGYGGFGYGRYGGYRGFGGWGGYGWGGGFGGFGYGPEVYSQTIFNAYVAMRISRAADNQSVFEGRAETVSRTNDLTRLVPPLVDALFTGFPGNSGETIRVRLPTEPGRPAAVKKVAGSAPS